ncbi:hypothetical protein GCM10011391_13220 [Pullulanibacillus camelliae]|uniref:DUF58 domain-containing protein n=1 Tax=Pullulanibacillus camelliae TaxID=1707096 RepID=A0A8J2VP95_9BACL|nr:DUF58 domain-containing protein [Pullulanibacillus camelliae]GGE35801.1 hypothetical protein GCM10011391_13220 [Pullulanibacillus camelliae]
MIKRLRRYQTILGVAWILLLFLIAFSYAMFQGGFVSWFVFYSFLPILVYTLFVVFYPLRDLQMTRSLNKEELFANEVLEVSIRIKRRLPIPLFYIVVEDQQPTNSLKRQASWRHGQTKKLFALGFRLNATLTYSIEAMPRGYYHFDTISVRTGDIFGFIQKEKAFAVSSEVIVYPQKLPLRSWKPLNLSYGGQHRSRKSFERDLTSISSIRDYTPGDRLSWLDWKATARANRLVTKEFELPLNNDVVMAIDCSQQEQDREGEGFERAVSLVSALVDRALKTEAKLQFMSISHHITSINEEDGDFQRWKILNHLARIESVKQPRDILKLTAYLQRMTKQVTLVFVTTVASDALVLQFNELISRGLAVECFLVTSKKASQESQYWRGVLSSIGVVTHVVSDGHDAAFEQAGDSLATS